MGQSSMRINIECAFGILVRKWLILKRTFEVDLHYVKDIIMACVILHNFTLRPSDTLSSIPVPDNASSHLADADPEFAGDQHTEPHDHHNAIEARGRSTLREQLTEELQQAGMLRPLT